MTDGFYCCRSLTQTCPRKASFTTASPFQCLPWRCSNWESGGKRKGVKSSSWCSSLTRKGLGKLQTAGDCDRSPSCSSLEGCLTCFQAVAPQEQAASAGDGRHRGQAAFNGGEKTQRSQVGAHCVRPRHGAFEPRERQSQLHSL